MRGDVGECGLARAAAEGKGSAGGAWAEMARPCGDGACGAHCGQQLGVEHPHQERMVGDADAREELLEGAALGGVLEGPLVGTADGTGVADWTGVVVGAVVGADVDPQTVSESPAPPLASSFPRSFTMVQETSDGHSPLLLTEMV